MTKQLTLTIGIPAKNEAKNIGMAISSVLQQKEIGYIMEKVIVISDGSTDNTVPIVRQMYGEDRRIICVDEKESLGKIKRLTQLFQLNKSDLILILDADCQLADVFTLKSLVEQVQGKVCLVGGHDLSFPPHNFTSLVTAVTQDWWYQIRKDIRGGDTIHNSNGLCLLLTKDFADSVTFPPGLSADSKYLYLLAKEKGYRFAFAPNAKIYTRLADNYPDFVKQNVRFISGKDILKQYFPNLDTEFSIPFKHKLIGTLNTFIQYPFILPVVLLYQLILRFIKPFYRPKIINGIWEPVHSTKV